MSLNIEIGDKIDMSSKWGKGTYIYKITQPTGENILIKLKNRFVYVNCIVKKFEKDIIEITASDFVTAIANVENDIKGKFIKKFSSFKNNDVEWGSSIMNGSTATATVPKNCLIKSIGNLNAKSDIEDLRSTSFSAYLVLTIPYIFYNEDKNKCTLPLHVKSIGIVKYDDDFADVDINKLKLAE